MCAVSGAVRECVYTVSGAVRECVWVDKMELFFCYKEASHCVLIC